MRKILFFVRLKLTLKQHTTPHTPSSAAPSTIKTTIFLILVSMALNLQTTLSFQVVCLNAIKQYSFFMISWYNPINNNGGAIWQFNTSIFMLEGPCFDTNLRLNPQLCPCNHVLAIWNQNKVILLCFIE